MKLQLHYNQNTNYATMKIQTTLQSKYKLDSSQSTNYTTMKIQTTLQWKHKLRYIEVLGDVLGRHAVLIPAVIKILDSKRR